MRYGTCVLLLIGALAACETAIDPSTGQSQTRWTLPFTSAKADAQEQRWQQCIQFRSQSNCERTVPGGRPPGTRTASPVNDYDSQDRNDP